MFICDFIKYLRPVCYMEKYIKVIGCTKKIQP